jgi:hypothetical protein
VTDHQARIIAELHRRYGPVFRTAPDQLSYNVEEAWQDIYGKPPQHNTQLPKSPLQFTPTHNSVDSMIQEPDDVELQRMR